MIIKEKNKFNTKKIFSSKLTSKLTIIFLFMLIAPTLLIYYLYSIIESTNAIVPQEIIVFTTIVILMIIILIAIVSFYISRSISKPIVKIYNSIKELEKGNYNVILNIKTGDEIELLSKALNQTTLTLGKIVDQRAGLDKAKTEFLSIISHELRNPLTPMKAQLQMLEEGYFGDISEKQKESINIITKNTDRLNNLINDLLDISRLELARLRFNFRETDIVQIINETVKFMDHFAKEKNIKIEKDIGKLPVLKVDPDRISQVLRNIINNAIKFSNNNSKIIISAYKKNDYILFSVQDNGCGLSPEDQIRVFEPFYQVENVNKYPHDGTGLGLAICRGIIKSQKGEIWVESELNNGSKFYFTFPINPVREIKPIKVLFSKKEVFEKKSSNNNFKQSELNKIKQEDKWTENEFDAIFIFDENAKILDCNENMFKRLGYSKSEILSLNLSDIDILDSKKDIFERIKKTKKEGVISFKTIHKRKDGSIIFVTENLKYNKNINQFKGIIRKDY